jgi:hypothetical protein
MHPARNVAHLASEDDVDGGLEAFEERLRVRRQLRDGLKVFLHHARVLARDEAGEAGESDEDGRGNGEELHGSEGQRNDASWREEGGRGLEGRVRR